MLEEEKPGTSIAATSIAPVAVADLTRTSGNTQTIGGEDITVVAGEEVIIRDANGLPVPNLKERLKSSKQDLEASLGQIEKHK